MSKFFMFLLLLITGSMGVAHAQTVDTAIARQVPAAKDTVVKLAEDFPVFKETDSTVPKDPNVRIPRVAAIRSAILPGWGQIYNKKAWKAPIVWAALGTTGTYFVNNLVWYKRTRFAYKVAYNIQSSGDSTGYTSVNSYLQRVFFINNFSPSGLKEARDYYRRYVDYSAVYFVLAWALNVVDATVDAHLSGFDISPDLAFKIQPGYSEMARTSGISFVLQFK
ncbi:MAG: DUF5683 domain-containing protein [Niabella sp.]